MTTITALLPSGQTATLVIDAVIRETFSFPAKITEHPVDEGSDVSDNIRAEAQKWQLECAVSNTPLPPIKDPNTNRAEAALAMLVDWQAQGALLTIPLTIDTLYNMAVENIGGAREAKTLGVIHFTLSVKRIRIVRNKLTQIKTSRPATVAKTKGGATPPAKAAPIDKSAWASGLDTAVGLVPSLGNFFKLVLKAP